MISKASPSTSEEGKRASKQKILSYRPRRRRQVRVLGLCVCWLTWDWIVCVCVFGRHRQPVSAAAAWFVLVLSPMVTINANGNVRNEQFSILNVSNTHTQTDRNRKNPKQICPCQQERIMVPKPNNIVHGNHDHDDDDHHHHSGSMITPHRRTIGESSNWPTCPS